MNDYQNAPPTFDELPNYVAGLKDEIRTLTQTVQDKIQPPKEDTRMTLKEAAKFLGIAPDTLKRKCYIRIMPFIKQGKNYIFYRSMIEAYEKKSIIPAIHKLKH